MAKVSIITAVKANGASGGTTSAVDTTGAQLIVIAASYGSAGITISDSAGNTWVAGTQNAIGTQRSRLYYCINPTTSATHTFTVSGASSVSSIVVDAFNGFSPGVAFDSQIATGTNAGNVFSIAGATSFTPTANDALVVSAQALIASVSAFAAGSGWTLSGHQNYVGSTSYGSGLVYKVQTTATAIPNTEHTADWTTSVSATSTTMAFIDGSAGDTISITTPAQYKTFQRSGTTGSVSISGSVTGATEDVEASFNGGAYQTIATAVVAGPFSGTLTGQAQGQGTLTVRKKTTTTASDTKADIGIGDVFVVAGDSIAEGRATNVQSYTHATLKATKFDQSDIWGNGNDPIDVGTNMGSHWPLLATQIMASQSVPVAFISVATGSTDVAGSNNQWAKNNSSYAEMTAQVTASGVNSVKGVLMHLGPNAVTNASTLSLATYNTAIDTLASNIAADLAGAPKLNIGIFGEMTTGSPPDRRAAIDNIRGAIIQAQDDNANVEPGPVLIEQDYSDGVHPKSDAEILAVAKRWWAAISETYYSGSSGRGPRFSSAQWDAGRTNLTVVFDRILKTGLTFGTGAWIVSDDGTPMTVSSVAYSGSNTSAVVLTTSAAAVGAANTTTVTFASSNDAVGVVIPLSADITMASGAAIQIPAEPIYSETVSEAGSLSVSLTLTTNGTTPAANLSSLKWAFFDQVSPGSFVAPTAKGTIESTDSTGLLVIDVTGTSLTAGQTGWLIITDSDGTTTQSPAAKAFSGPVLVS